MERFDKNKKLAEKMRISINFVKKNKKEKNKDKKGDVLYGIIFRFFRCGF